MTLTQHLIQLSQHLPPDIQAILSQIQKEAESTKLDKKVLEITLEETQQLVQQFQTRAVQLTKIAESYKKEAENKQKEAENSQILAEISQSQHRVGRVENAKLEAEIQNQIEILKFKEVENVELKRKIRVLEGIFEVEFEKKVRLVGQGGVEMVEVGCGMDSGVGEGVESGIGIDEEVQTGPVMQTFVTAPESANTSIKVPESAKKPRKTSARALKSHIETDLKTEQKPRKKLAKKPTQQLSSSEDLFNSTKIATKSIEKQQIFISSDEESVKNELQLRGNEQQLSDLADTLDSVDLAETIEKVDLVDTAPIVDREDHGLRISEDGDSLKMDVEDVGGAQNLHQEEEVMLDSLEETLKNDVVENDVLDEVKLELEQADNDGVGDMKLSVKYADEFNDIENEDFD